MAQAWRGNSVTDNTGGGYKINLMKAFFEQFKNDSDKLILFVDSYDVILAGAAADVVSRFKNSSSRIFFSAEVYCWPDTSLAEQYPIVDGRYRYLNSGCFIGYAADLYNLVTLNAVADDGDDQRYFTNIYLNETLRTQMKFKLDSNCTLFQNLYGASNDISIESLDGDDSHVKNIIHQTRPVVIHGNGHAKITVNSIGNYVAKSWTTNRGCLACAENRTDLLIDENLQNEDEVLMGVFIVKPTPFIEHFFERLLNLSYSKSKIHLRIYNGVPYHARNVREFVGRVSGASIDCEESQSVVEADNSCPAADETSRTNYYIYKSVKVLGIVEDQTTVVDEKMTKAFDNVASDRLARVRPLSEAEARATIM